MNPLLDTWLMLWNRLTGNRYYSPRRANWQQLFDALDQTMHQLRWQIFYGVFAPRYIDTEEFAVMLNLVQRKSLKPHFRYRHFTKPKKDGTKRELVEPDERLKKIQQKILERYLRTAQVHPSAVGFRRKKSIADHAWAHAGANYIITADIQDFFPSTQAWRVKEWWETQFPDSEQAAQFLTVLTTYQDCLPQGAPTSPALSNVINFQMDKQLDQRVQHSGGMYTRYCDDMVFSWQGNARPPSDFANGVRATLHEFGYTLHPTKGWQVHTQRDEPEITGVILTKRGTVALTDELKHKIRTLESSDDEADQHRLAGYRGFQHMIEDHQEIRQAPTPDQTVSLMRNQPDDYDEDDEDDYEDEEYDEDYEQDDYDDEAYEDDDDYDDD
jgi:RNA-directed DNA polymerase